MTLPKGCKLLFRKDDYKDKYISDSEDQHKKKVIFEYKSAL